MQVTPYIRRPLLHIWIKVEWVDLGGMVSGLGGLGGEEGEDVVVVSGGVSYNESVYEYKYKPQVPHLMLAVPYNTGS